MNEFEISFDELKSLFPTAYLLVDVRNEEDIEYGMLPGAVWMSPEEFRAGLSEEWMNCLKEAPQVILYCKKGERSLEFAEKLQAEGIQARSLSGGYLDYILNMKCVVFFTKQVFKVIYPLQKKQIILL